MAETLFKGFKQVLGTSGQTLNFENGYLYFVRTSEDKTDGYLYLNGKKYGTAEEAKALIAATKAEILGEIGTQEPNTIAGLLAEINELSDIIGTGFSGSTITEEIQELKTTVETLTGGDSSIDARIQSAITALNLDETYEAKGAASSALTEAKAYTDEVVSSATTRITALEGKAHEHANADVLSGITAEKVSKWDQAATDDHTHTNKTVLDGITADKVTAWDAAQANVIESINVNGVDATIEGKKATVTIPEATTSKSGVMSASDKSKLDGIATGAEVNYIKSVGDNLAVDASGKLTVTIPAAEVTGVAENDSILSLNGTELSSTLSLSYDSTAKEIYLKGKDNKVISTVNATDFIKDGMIDNVAWSTGKTNTLVITFNTDAGKQAIEVDFQKLVDTYTAGNGIDVNGQVVSVKINNADSGVKLSADTNGLQASIMIEGDDVN